MGGQVSITKLAGFLFFGFYFFHYNPTFGKRSFPRIPAAVWWFLVYLGVYMMNWALFGSAEFRGEFVSRIFQFVQLIALLWICSDLLKDQRIARSVLLAYIIAATLFALGIVLKVPGFYEQEAEGRMSGIGENPNAVAANSGMAILMIFGLFLYMSYRYRFHRKLFLMILSLPLFASIVLSGSRGSVLAFLMGVMVYLFPYWRSKRVLTAIFIVALASSAVVYFVATNPHFLERWNRTYYEGSLEGREEIFAIAIEMILEQPILGWQPIDYYYELGARSGGRFLSKGRDAHNLFLTVLLQVGVIGAIPFFVGLWLCGQSAWRARLGNLGLLPLALLVSELTVGMSGTNLRSKPHWLILALTLAAAPNAGRVLRNRFPVLLVNRPSKAAEKAS